MYYVYVLKSQKDERLYFGFTSDLKRRMIEHNSGMEKSTKYGVPWTLVYFEAFLSGRDASKREKQLKKYKSAYGFLKQRIRESVNET